MKNMILIFFLGILTSACKKNMTKSIPDCSDVVSCPSLKDKLSWDNYPYTYGKGWSQYWDNEYMSGYDGYSVKSYLSLINNRANVPGCGWKIYNGETGGCCTFAVYMPPDTSLIFRWAYGKLSQFVVSYKWLGETSEGIKMGDTRSKFLSVYPKFYADPYDPSIYYFNNSGIQFPDIPNLVTAFFTNNTSSGVLKGLKVATGYLK